MLQAVDAKLSRHVHELARCFKQSLQCFLLLVLLPVVTLMDLLLCSLLQAVDAVLGQHLHELERCFKQSPQPLLCLVHLPLQTL
jgi:hypothetical protein